MIFHENRLLADNSHEISYFIFFEKLGKISQNLSSAAVVIGTLRVNLFKIFQERYQRIKWTRSIRTDILSVLIWVQTVCNGYQQTTKVATSKES